MSFAGLSGAPSSSLAVRYKNHFDVDGRTGDGVASHTKKVDLVGTAAYLARFRISDVLIIHEDGKIGERWLSVIEGKLLALGAPTARPAHEILPIKREVAGAGKRG